MEQIYKYELPFFYDCVIENNKIYFPLADFNALCEGDLTNDQISILDVFPDTPLNKSISFPGIYKHGDNMLFTSYKNCDNDILMYNMRQHKYFKFSNKDGLLLYSDTVFKKDDNIYIISKTL